MLVNICAAQPRICALPLLLQVYGADKALPYVVPSPNVRIECPLALVDKVLDNRPAEAREAAHAFANFLFTSEAQVGAGGGVLLAAASILWLLMNRLAAYPSVAVDA